MFSSLIEREDLYRNHTRSEVKLILRYHCYAIMGLLQDWTPEDTENLDQIVHLIFLLITEGISLLHKTSYERLPKQPRCKMFYTSAVLSIQIGNTGN